MRTAVGIDFGTESGRALLVDVATGRELASAVFPYSNGVIDVRLPAPDDDVELAPDWALQDPIDYIRTIQHTVPAVLAQAGVDPADVIGVGIDFTACTMLPTTRDGTPLSAIPELRREPHAWVKLWKHHAAQPQADRINALARERGEPWLQRYGGKISSEWFFGKSLQIIEEAPAIYAAADRLIEAADWVAWRLTGVETRNSCTAGYKAMWSKADGFPDAGFFSALDPRLGHGRRRQDVADDHVHRIAGRRLDRRGRWLDRSAAGYPGRGRERGRSRLRPGVGCHPAGPDGRRDGHQHLPSRAGLPTSGRRGDVRRRRGRDPTGSIRVRSGAVRRRRHLRLVRRPRRAAGLPRRGAGAGDRRPPSPRARGRAASTG